MTLLPAAAEKVQGQSESDGPLLQVGCESVLTFCIPVWYHNAATKDKTQLKEVLSRSSKIIGCSLPSLSSFVPPD